MRGIKCLLSKEKFLDIYYGISICPLCGIKLTDGDDRRCPSGRSIDRIDSDKHYEESNVRIICYSCNAARKHDREKLHDNKHN